MLRRVALAVCCTAALILVYWSAALADDDGAPAATAPAAPYSGAFFDRSTLTGDWGGIRNDLAVKGITVDASLTQVGQGVVEGGKNGKWQYGGRGEILGNLDTQKLGLWPGGFLTLELEGNYNNAVNAKTGALMAANTNQLFPTVPAGNFNVPQLSF